MERSSRSCRYPVLMQIIECRKFRVFALDYSFLYKKKPFITCFILNSFLHFLFYSCNLIPYQNIYFSDISNNDKYLYYIFSNATCRLNFYRENGKCIGIVLHILSLCFVIIFIVFNSIYCFKY